MPRLLVKFNIYNIMKGLFTALITPFTQDEVDLVALKSIIDAQIAAGVKGLVIAGSTGEGNSLTSQEYQFLLEQIIDYVQGKIAVIATIGGSATNEVLGKLKNLSPLKLTAIMVTAPYYVRPEQDGLYQHFEILNDNSAHPLIIYTHPGRTGVNIEDKTVVQLSKLRNIIALKDATNDLAKPLKLQCQIKDNFSFLCGDDINVLAYSANGGSGIISVMSNIMPNLCNNITYHCQNNDFALARKMQQDLMEIMAAIFQESNPIGIKHACSLIYSCSNEVRLPLTAPSKDNSAQIKALIEKIIHLEKTCPNIIN
jgi:4-hydroxy-tetrahydrodipicolinate synthase